MARATFDPMYEEEGGDFADLEVGSDDEGGEGKAFEDEDDCGSEGVEDEEEDEAAADAREASATKSGANGSAKGKRKADEMDVDVPTAANHQTFALQVESLLSSITPPYNRLRPSLTASVSSLSSTLTALPPCPPLPLAEHRRVLAKEGVKLPVGDPKEDVNWKFGFDRVSKDAVRLAGSWAEDSRWGIKGEKGKARNGTIDVLVEMPSSLFQEKDYQADRYFHKRSHFLAHLHLSLKADPSFSHSFSFSYAPLRGRILGSIDEVVPWKSQPVLVLTPKEDAGELSESKTLIRLLPAYPEGTFPIPRLSPKRSNLKGDAATPSYNRSLLLDSSSIHRTHASYLSSTSSRFNSTSSGKSKPRNAFSSAVRLLKLWIRQRGITSLAGFDDAGWWLPFVVGHIVNGGGREGAGKTRSGQGKMADASEAGPIFRAVLEWLSKRDPEIPTYMAQVQGAQPFAEDDFSAPSTSILSDPTGLVNLLALVPLSSLDVLRQEARQTLSLLSLAAVDVFRYVFLQPAAAFILKYDLQCVVQLDQVSLDALKEGDQEDPARTLANIFRQALGNRTKAIAVIPDQRHGASPSLHIGLILDPVNCNSLVTRGPAPDVDPAGATAFRVFWGSRAELRRFQDGAIQLSVIWQADDMAQRARIPMEVVHWAVVDKCQISTDAFAPFVGAYDHLVQEQPEVVKTIYRRDPNVVGFTAAMTALDDLGKALRGLTTLPLGITNITAISPGLRYASTFMPGARKTKFYDSQPDDTKFVSAMDVNIAFESSGKWPDNLEAIQKIKAAFLSQLADVLLESRVVELAQIRLDADAAPTSDHVSVEVLHASGFPFRLRIHYEREAQLLEDAIDQADTNDVVARYARESSALYQRRFVDLPKHHGAIAALQQRCSTFTQAVRLTKRWMAAHWLSQSQMPEEVVELVCAAAYLSLSPFHAPASGATGFARVLSLLATWDWRTTPLLVPLSSAVGLDPLKLASFPLDAASQVAAAFAAHRRADPSLSRAAFFIATESDRAGKMWAWEKPSRLVAARVQELARAALHTLEDQARFPPDVEVLFNTPTAGYDFLIHIDERASTRQHQTLRPTRRVSSEGKDPLRFDYDPVTAFVSYLQSLYGEDTILFLSDPNGGLIVGGIFHPALTTPHAFRPTLTVPMVRLDTDEAAGDAQAAKVKKAKMVVDRQAVLEEIGRLGAGIVSRVVDCHQ